MPISDELKQSRLLNEARIQHIESLPPEEHELLVEFLDKIHEANKKKQSKLTIDEISFDYLLTRLTTLGALYLVFVCILPEFLQIKYWILKKQMKI